MINTVIWNGFHGYDPQDEPDFEEVIPEPEGWRFEFRDGSAIVVFEMEDPEIEVPHKRFAKKWDAETAKEFIMEEQLSADDSIEHITKNYDNN